MKQRETNCSVTNPLGLGKSQAGLLGPHPRQLSVEVRDRIKDAERRGSGPGTWVTNNYRSRYGKHVISRGILGMNQQFILTSLHLHTINGLTTTNKPLD